MSFQREPAHCLLEERDRNEKMLQVVSPPHPISSFRGWGGTRRSWWSLERRGIGALVSPLVHPAQVSWLRDTWKNLGTVKGEGMQFPSQFGPISLYDLSRDSLDRYPCMAELLKNVFFTFWGRLEGVLCACALGCDQALAMPGSWQQSFLSAPPVLRLK